MRLFARKSVLLTLAVLCTGAIAAAMVSPAFGSWPLDGILVVTSPNHQLQPILVEDGAGGVVVVWEDRTLFYPTETRAYAQRISAAGDRLWNTGGVLLFGRFTGTYLGRVVGDGTGGAFVLNQASYVQHVGSTGTILWATDGVDVLPAFTGTQQSQGGLARDGADGVFVTWSDHRDSGTNWLNFYAQRIDPSGNLLWGTSGLEVAASAFDEWPGPAVEDGTGGAIVFWRHDLNRTDYQARAQRLRPSGAKVWPDSGVVVGSGWARAVVEDGAGGAVILFSVDDEDTTDLFAQRVDSSGTLLWPGAVAVCPGGSPQAYPVWVVGDGGGGAIFAWEDRRDPGAGIYAQSVDAGGTAQWTADGVSAAPGHGAWPELLGMVSDDAGGAIVLIYDYYASTDNVQAQHFDAAGYRLWGSTGVTVCHTGSLQKGAGLAKDGSGGAIVAWEDFRNLSDVDLYARTLDASPVSVAERPTELPALSTVSSAPNPFETRTAIRFQVESNATVRLEIYDVGGRRVRAWPAQTLPSGWHELVFDGRDDGGRTLPSGVYFCRVFDGLSARTLKLVIRR